MSSQSSSDPSKNQSPSKPKTLDLPTPPGPSRPRHNLPTAPGQLPATALFHGPHSRNASNNSVNRGAHSRDDRSTGTPVDRDRDRDHQHLPRALTPTSSFSGVARPSLINDHKVPLPRASYKNPPNNLGGQPTGIGAVTSKKDDEFRADAVWAEMQKTLADVELSAMNSSHVFSAAHVGALEDLRSAQLGLAGAWARSEAEEGVDEEFGRDGGEMGDAGASVGGGFAGTGMGTGSNSASPRSAGGNAKSAQSGSRRGSTASNLEEETERDIKLARRRREANDRYFRQVNSGVVDVVKRLDEVVGAMRRVEKESREIWNSSESGGETEDLGVQTETDESVRRQQGRKRAGTKDTVATTDSEVLTDSPGETRGS
ncbi:hypothetical protein PMZ80_002239 [Knufia obscura]|uniref:Uncharacterized protein n=2 Tax=Knufia TaxID=430999 RepID=A0AAN8I3Q5_9EURO|nr:hypothetical protein PMZ80_002239 [Knufia obscura]KAK5950599.1 hypothetical protein OHC33_008265 [Knufia fluminis]